ncbi:MAG: nucleoside deaminase [Reyranella sp.]|uniref:nucleoside deaminase n=1 Tax=Reyranella sp. TaxID=1929291 RepID=UPI001AD0E3D4|nr:nucleoside deaminase [Reyranella sp.]MBN9091403.1 nucleoside deaminase [Reyranella sp.]
MTNHEAFMRQAMELGETAGREGDLGIGCVIVRDGTVIGRGRNRMNTQRNPMVHAETDAIADALKALGTADLSAGAADLSAGAADLSGATLYTTMEPCPMCAGAMMNTGIRHWVMGGRLKAVGRVIGRYTAESFVAFVDADVEITTGVLAAECEALRNRYFRK